MFNAPQPRSRLYTRLSFYFQGLRAMIPGLRRETGSVEKLEHALERLAPGYHAVALPMARTGIYLALKYCLRPGQKVILSPYTISDVVNMVLCAGGIPLFADIEAGGTCNINPEKVAELLATETNVGAVLITHFYGLLCDVEAIAALCHRFRIPLIEDAAQGLGARHNNRPAGALADIGILSFGLMKTITSFYGGALLTRDKSLAESIRNEMSAWPPMPKIFFLKRMIKGAAFDLATTPLVFNMIVYWIFRYALLHGRNFFGNKFDIDANPKAYSDFPGKFAVRMNDVQAEILLQQLDGVDAQAKERIAKAKLYHEGLANLPGLTLPPLLLDGSHVYNYFPIQCENREKVSLFLTRRLRDVQVSHHRNCADMACYDDFFQNCPNAAKAEKNVLYLPAYPGYKESQVTANIEALRAFFAKDRGSAS